MAIHGDVGGAGLVRRRINDADHAPFRQRLGGDVRPCGTAVARDPDEAVVGAGPEQALLHRRLGKRENRVVVLDRRDVERDRSSRGMLLALVVARQVLADGGPAHAAVGALVHLIAGGVERSLIVLRYK